MTSERHIISQATSDARNFEVHIVGCWSSPTFMAFPAPDLRLYMVEVRDRISGVDFGLVSLRPRAIAFVWAQGHHPTSVEVLPGSLGDGSANHMLDQRIAVYRESLLPVAPDPAVAEAAVRRAFSDIALLMGVVVL